MNWFPFSKVQNVPVLPKPLSKRFLSGKYHNMLQTVVCVGPHASLTFAVFFVCLFVCFLHKLHVQCM